MERHKKGLENRKGPFKPKDTKNVFLIAIPGACRAKLLRSLEVGIQVFSIISNVGRVADSSEVGSYPA